MRSKKHAKTEFNWRNEVQKACQDGELFLQRFSSHDAALVLTSDSVVALALSIYSMASSATTMISYPLEQAHVPWP